MRDVAKGACGCGRNILRLSRAIVKAMEASESIASISNVGIYRIGSDGAALPGAHWMPVAKSNRPVIAAAGSRDGSTVLLRAVDAVGKLIIHSNVVKLRGWLVVP